MKINIDKIDLVLKQDFTELIDETIEKIETSKLKKDKNEETLKATEISIKIKKESSELEAEQTILQEISKDLRESAFPEYLQNQIIENILLLSSAKLQSMSSSMSSSVSIILQSSGT